MLYGGLFHDYKVEELNNIVIEQYANLLDIAEKEIYAGDIISADLNGMQHFRAVEYGNGGFFA
jgi:hypothetical protein